MQQAVIPKADNGFLSTPIPDAALIRLRRSFVQICHSLQRRYVVFTFVKPHKCPGDIKN